MMVKEKKRLKTINVIEVLEGRPIGIHSFTDDAEGRKEAERVFRACARDNGFSRTEIGEGIEEGELSHSEGEYVLSLLSGFPV